MWNKITNFLSFTGVADKIVWQDVIFSSFLIPVVIFLGAKFLKWWNKTRPSRIVFKNYLPENSNVFIFHSQMSSADDNYNKKSNPKFITLFPDPTPTNHINFGIQTRQNIDPVCSVANAECLADVLNVLGLINKTKNIHIGDLIKDWNIWKNPIFTIGFNPKTEKLTEKCNPIYFDLSNASLKIKNTSIIFDSISPNDAGIIQKTFDKESENPVFILAGLGTTGTSAAGLILRNNFIKLGKLFGNDPFCVFLKAKIDEGKNSALIKKIVPNPKWYRIIMHPTLYFSFKNKGYFEIKNGK